MYVTQLVKPKGHWLSVSHNSTPVCAFPCHMYVCMSEHNSVYFFQNKDIIHAILISWGITFFNYWKVVWGKSLEGNKSIYENNNFAVRIGDKHTDFCPHGIGVKQGCNLNPTSLFTLLKWHCCWNNLHHLILLLVKCLFYARTLSYSLLLK